MDDAARDGQAVKRSRAARDPQGRKRALAQAAAEVILEEGPAKLTHRKVAARAGVPLGSTTQHFASIEELRLAGLQVIAAEMDAGYREFCDELRACMPAASRAEDAGLCGPEPGLDLDALTRAFADYLDDAEQVRRDAALTAAAVTFPEIRALAAESEDRLLDAMRAFMDADKARALCMLSDGSMTYACLHGKPPDRNTIRFCLERIMA